MRRGLFLAALAAGVVCVLLAWAVVATAAYEVQSGKDATGVSYRLPYEASVPAPYSYWAWTISPVGIEGASVTNAGRYQVHHRMVVSSTYHPIARIDLLHTNAAAADTIAFKVYNGGVADSLVWITSALGQVSFPVIGDSVAFKPYKASAAGDWYITTYFLR